MRTGKLGFGGGTDYQSSPVVLHIDVVVFLLIALGTSQLACSRFRGPGQEDCAHAGVPSGSSTQQAQWGKFVVTSHCAQNIKYLAYQQVIEIPMEVRFQ